MASVTGKAKKPCASFLSGKKNTQSRSNHEHKIQGRLPIQIYVPTNGKNIPELSEQTSGADAGSARGAAGVECIRFLKQHKIRVASEMRHTTTVVMFQSMVCMCVYGVSTLLGSTGSDGSLALQLGFHRLHTEVQIVQIHL